MNNTEDLWNELAVDHSFKSGVVLRKYPVNSVSDIFAALIMPEKIKSIALRINSEAVNNLEFMNDLREIKLKIYPDELYENKKLLVISLVEECLSEIFAVLCEDLVEKISQIGNQRELVNSLLKRLQEWEELFQKSKGPALTLDMQKGLYGELYFLNRMLEYGINQVSSIESWKGPEPGIRDFEHNGWAVEVKTTSAEKHQKLYINNSRQLDTTILDFIYILHLSVEILSGAGNTLPAAVREIEEKILNNLHASSMFRMKLIKAGYIHAHEGIYERTEYVIRQERYYHIKDNFPRIEEHEIRSGVGDVRYSVIPPGISTYDVTFEKVIDTAGVM